MRKQIVIFSLLLSGCRGVTEPAAQKPAEQPDSSGGRASVQLSPAAVKNAGIETVPVRRSPVQKDITATGQMTVNEDRTWLVGALTEGRVVSVHARVGDMVKNGQVLARIHSHQVHEARADWTAARFEVERAEAQAALARRLRDRAGRLLELRAGSQQELETAEAQLRNAEAAVRNAKVELEKHRVHITEFLDVPLEELHADGEEHDYIPVRAPAAGLVYERTATQGTVVSQGDAMFRITSPASLWMTANVSEADLGSLRPGQPVKVSVRAWPDRSFSGTVLRLGEQLDPETRTLQVRVQVPNAAGMLKPGMYATASIAAGGTREALLVPQAAAQEIGGARAVFVRTGAGRFEPRAIEVAATRDGMLEVGRGLQPNDEVVVKGAFILKSHMLQSTLSEE